MYDWNKAEAQIIKGVWANETGRKALTIIVERLAGLHTMSFDPGNTFQTAYNEGRRSTGHDLMRAINLPLDQLCKDVTDESRRSSLPSATERAAATAINGGRPTKRRGTVKA